MASPMRNINSIFHEHGWKDDWDPEYGMDRRLRTGIVIMPVVLLFVAVIWTFGFTEDFFIAGVVVLVIICIVIAKIFENWIFANRRSEYFKDIDYRGELVMHFLVRELQKQKVPFNYNVIDQNGNGHIWIGDQANITLRIAGHNKKCRIKVTAKPNSQEEATWLTYLIDAYTGKATAIVIKG